MSERKAPLRKDASIIISKPIGFGFNPNPVEVMQGKKIKDKISKGLNNLLVGVDISNFKNWRKSDGKGNFYYNTSGWRLVDAVEEQRKNNPLLKDKEYHERLRMGLGPYNIYIPEDCCQVIKL